MASYKHTISLDQQAVTLVLLIQSEKVKDKNAAILKLYDLLLPISKEEAKYVIEKLFLGNDTCADMLQSSWIKLVSVLPSYNYEKSPCFIPFWRICLRNYLLSEYKKNYRATELIDDYAFEDSPENSIYLEDLRNRYGLEMEAKEQPVYLAVLMERCLAETSQRTTQRILAERFGVSQGYISRLENVIKKKIQRDQLLS